jgi:hypothetical protein
MTELEVITLDGEAIFIELLSTDEYNNDGFTSLTDCDSAVWDGTGWVLS